MTKWIGLSLREMPGLKVELPDNPANTGLDAQVMYNRKARALLANDNVQASDVLMVYVLVDGVQCYVDTDALLVHYFWPHTKAEKWAVSEAEQAVLCAARNRNIEGQALWNKRRLTYAKEIFWLAITGHMIEKEEAQPTNKLGYIVLSSWDTGTNEPADKALLDA